MEQGSEEWFEARCGKVTASKIADVMAAIKNGEAAARRNYRMELLCQRLTGGFEEGFTSGPMLRGIELEPIARGTYEGENGIMVEQVSFIDHPTIEMFGASPDGRVGDEGMLEIKCPNTATHIEFMLTEKIPPRYEWQMTAQMVCDGRKWCDFVSFDDRLPDALAYRCKRYHLDEPKAAMMVQEIMAFIGELNTLENEMRAIMGEKK